MKKYKCTNGEIVEVEDIHKGDKYILVHYKGKVYRREIGVIGKTLFPVYTENTNNAGNVYKAHSKQCKRHGSIKIGSKVKLKSRDGIEVFTICGVKTEKNYTRMGGSYYGSKVSVSTVGVHIKDSSNEHTVSVVSPLGKELLNNNKGDVVDVVLPNGSVEQFLILDVY